MPRKKYGETSFGERLQNIRKARGLTQVCLLYTSDAADERSSVDLGGRRIIKKKKNRDSIEQVQPEISNKEKASRKEER